MQKLVPKDRNFDRICGALKSAQVVDGYPSYENLESLRKINLGAADKWISHDELIIFALMVASRAVYERTRDDATTSGTSGSLQVIIGEEAIYQITNEILDHLSSLPITYQAFLSLDNLEADEYCLESYEILTIDTFPKPPRGLLIPGSGGNYFFRLSLSAEGHANYSLDNSAFLSALDGIKVILNFLITHGLIVVNRLRLQNSGLVFNATQDHVIEKKRIVLYHDIVDKSYSAQLPLDLTTILHSLELSDAIKNLPAAEIAGLMIRVAKPAVNLLINNSVEAKAIRSAAEWLFNSRLSENETISFLQVCFGLEALFGGGDSVNITKQLANRCAFAVAKKVSERSGIIEKFEEFYKIRSKIVHGQLTRLRHEDKNMMRWAQDLLTRAIASETIRL